MGKYAMLIKNKDGKYILIFDSFYFLTAFGESNKTYYYNSFFDYVAQHYVTWASKKDVISSALTYLSALKNIKEYKEEETEFNKCLKSNKREAATCQIISAEKAYQMANNSLNLTIVPNSSKKRNHTEWTLVSSKKNNSLKARRYNKNLNEERKKLRYHNL